MAKSKTGTYSTKTSKVRYVDGFVLVVKNKDIKEYKKIAKKAGKVWMKHGALAYYECKGDDLNPTHELLKFPKLMKTKRNETVWYSFITYKNKRHRDAVNKKVFKDPAMQPDKDHEENMPFDMKRMAFGGFKVEVGM